MQTVQGADLDPRHRTGHSSRLLVHMPELGRLDAKAAASLAGLAPATRESGQWKGYSFIRGGRGRARRLLYMSALTAIRYNPDLARQYTALRERGKPPKVALTAVMRKLVILANALLHQNRLWTPDPASSSRKNRTVRPPTSRAPPPQPSLDNMDTHAHVEILDLA